MLGSIAIAASVPLGVGLLLGAGVALVGLFIAPDMQGLADLVGRAFWLLAGLLPLGLWLGIFMSYKEEEHAASYGSLVSTAATTIQAALLGGGLGAGPFYLLAATYVPVIFGGYDIALWSVAVRSQILWLPWLAVLGITVLAALPLAYWAYRTGPA